MNQYLGHKKEHKFAFFFLAEDMKLALTSAIKEKHGRGETIKWKIELRIEKGLTWRVKGLETDPPKLAENKERERHLFNNILIFKEQNQCNTEGEVSPQRKEHFGCGRGKINVRGSSKLVCNVLRTWYHPHMSDTSQPMNPSYYSARLVWSHHIYGRMGEPWTRSPHKSEPIQYKEINYKLK